MNWKKEAEHLRDYGHTWGPGHEKEDQLEWTEEELRAEEEAAERYRRQKEAGRVAPREKYAQAGEALKKTLPSHHDIICGQAPLNWREDYSDQKLALCKDAAGSLGYSFGLRDGTEDRASLMVGVMGYGNVPGRGGNLHYYAASGIRDLEDHLQLVADFRAIGMHCTSYYKDRHISLDDTGELRMEMEKWGLDFGSRKPSLSSQIQTAFEIAQQVPQGGSQPPRQRE